MTMATVDAATGKNRLFNDSKFGVLVTGGATLAIDALLKGAIDALTNLDTSGWSGWWTTVAAAAVATALGAFTAYKAKREKARLGRAA
jgi:hypothetical protein